MLQDTIILSASSVEKAWPGCYIALGEVESFSRPAAPYLIDSIVNTGLILLIIFFFLFSYERILEGLYYIVTSFLSLKKMLIIENQFNIQISRNTLFFFLVIIASFIMANRSEAELMLDNTYPVIIRFAVILALTGAYLLFRRIFFSLLSWVNSNGIFMVVNKISYSYLVLWILFALAGLILNTVFLHLDFSLIALYLMAGAFLTFMLYFIRGYQLIVANGFSQFFYILYLCTLEILPMIILAHLIFG